MNEASRMLAALATAMCLGLQAFGQGAAALPVSGYPGLSAQLGSAGNLHVVAVGIGNYEEYEASPGPAAAAERLGRAFADRFGASRVELLIDASATRNGIIRSLSSMASQASSADSLVVYLSGRWRFEPLAGEAVFLPYEAGRDAVEQRSWLGLNLVMGMLSRSDYRHILLLGEGFDSLSALPAQLAIFEGSPLPARAAFQRASRAAALAEGRGLGLALATHFESQPKNPESFLRARDIQAIALAAGSRRVSLVSPSSWGGAAGGELVLPMGPLSESGPEKPFERARLIADLARVAISSDGPGAVSVDGVEAGRVEPGYALEIEGVASGYRLFSFKGGIERTIRVEITGGNYYRIRFPEASVESFPLQPFPGLSELEALTQTALEGARSAIAEQGASLGAEMGAKIDTLAARIETLARAIESFKATGTLIGSDTLGPGTAPGTDPTTEAGAAEALSARELFGLKDVNPVGAPELSKPVTEAEVEKIISLSPYALGLRKSLKPGTRVRAILSYERVTVGMEGRYMGIAQFGYPDCCVLWDDINDAQPVLDALPPGIRSAERAKAYFVPWDAIEIVPAKDAGGRAPSGGL